MYYGETPRTKEELIKYLNEHNFEFWEGEDDQITKYVPLSINNIIMILEALEKS